MQFFIEHQGQLVETFEAPNHREALAAFEARKLEGHVLRDYQKYKVDQETIRECESWASIDFLRTGRK